MSNRKTSGDVLAVLAGGPPSGCDDGAVGVGWYEYLQCRSTKHDGGKHQYQFDILQYQCDSDYGPGGASLHWVCPGYIFQWTSQAGKDDYEISGYMIADLLEETRSPREVEQEDRQRVMSLLVCIDFHFM